MRFRRAVTQLGTLRQASRINVAAGTLIVAAFAFATSTAILSTESELVDSSELIARDWVDSALAHNNAVRRALKGRLQMADAHYFRTIAGIGSVFRYRLIHNDGSVALDSFNLTPGRRFDEETGSDLHQWSDSVVIRHGTSATVAPGTTVIVDVPIVEDGRRIGAARVYLDQTDTAAMFANEAWTSVVLSALLAGLGLGNCIAVGVLLKRQRRNEDRIHHLAHHDPLTGIANRNVFQERLGGLFMGRRPGDGRIALHLVDVDGFKSVNDQYGHHGGDALLRRIATTLAGTVRDGDVVARIGGDEFAVIQRDVATLQQASALADRLVRAVRQIRDIDGMPLTPSLSVGVAYTPEHAASGEELQQAADAALYRAKALGRDRFVVFEAGMDEGLRRRNELRVLVRRAVSEELFLLHYQPLHTGDGAVSGFEALLRLRDDKGAFVSPAEFIPIAEEMALTPEIGAWVLNQAARTAAAWPETLSIAVNLSVQQFDTDLTETVARALADTGLSPNRLELEITESMFIAEPDKVDAVLRDLKDLGVRIAMDDFGTGYSSLSYIWQFPFDKLKVDRSCFKALGTSENVAKVLRIIAMMSNALDISLVAEGIETETQRLFACAAGYDELQGFLYCRPMPEEDVAAYIAGRPIAAERGTLPKSAPRLLQLLSDGERLAG